MNTCINAKWCNVYGMNVEGKSTIMPLATRDKKNSRDTEANYRKIEEFSFNSSEILRANKYQDMIKITLFTTGISNKADLLKIKSLNSTSFIYKKHLQ